MSWRPFGRRFFDHGILGMSPTLLGATVLVGLTSGVIGAVYLLAFHVLQHALWPDHWSTAAEFVVLGGTGVAVVVIGRALGSPGDVELLVDNIHVSGTAPAVRTLQSLVPMSLLTISAGGAAGPEAPLVTTCGTLAGWVARKRDLPVHEARCVTIAGMAAAFTVLFGAPLGSALFSLEILHRRGMEYTEALLPALLGSLSGYACYVVVTGADLVPAWHIAAVDKLHAVDLLWAVGAGIGGAVIAVTFTYLTLGLRRLFGIVPAATRPIVGGLGLALLAIWSPYALTFGEVQTGHVLGTRLSLTVLAVAVVAKLIGTSLTVSSGWPGGFIIPLFFIGATVGEVTHHAFAAAPVGVVCAGLMVAANVGVTKTLVGSVLIVSEMGGLRLLPTTLIAGAVAFILTSEVGLIHTQRERSPRSSDGPTTEDEP
ncbi:MAG TPA: chloride channel protein [Acidimicrobiia bacterium]